MRLDCPADTQEYLASYAYENANCATQIAVIVHVADCQEIPGVLQVRGDKPTRIVNRIVASHKPALSESPYSERQCDGSNGGKCPASAPEH